MSGEKTESLDDLCAECTYVQTKSAQNNLRCSVEAVTIKDNSSNVHFGIHLTVGDLTKHFMLQCMP